MGEWSMAWWPQESECLKLEMRAESERQGDWATLINLNGRVPELENSQEIIAFWD